MDWSRLVQDLPETLARVCARWCPDSDDAPVVRAMETEMAPLVVVGHRGLVGLLLRVGHACAGE